ncbi:MAG: hypothetical protein U0W40_01690 [Acidimicrobiia bacterium]
MVSSRPDPAPWAVAPNVDALVAGAAERVPLAVHGSRSGARFEHVVLGDAPFVLKHVDRADDWIMRQTGDLGCVPVTVWESGCSTCSSTASTTPPSARREIAADGSVSGAVLMRDVADALVPDDTTRLAPAAHLRFLDHLAACHAATLGWRDEVGLVPLGNRYSFFGPDALACEAARSVPHPVPSAARDAWTRLPATAPRLHELLAPLRAEPWVVLAALAEPPHAFLHGDWKLTNLGTDHDGRTVLVDWSVSGEGPLLTEVLHYATLNAARLPAGHTHDDVLDAYRAALEARGVRTGAWWDTQAAACTLGVMLQLGWARADDTPEGIAAWTTRVEDALRVLA